MLVLATSLPSTGSGQVARCQTIGVRRLGEDSTLSCPRRTTLHQENQTQARRLCYILGSDVGLKSEEILSHKGTKSQRNENRQKFLEKSQRKNRFQKGLSLSEQDAKEKISLMYYFVPFASSW